MKLKCIENKSDRIREVIGHEISQIETYPLIIGKEYTVYAIEENKNQIWFCICDESYFLYPMWRPYPLFEIVDNKLSRYWIFALDSSTEKATPIISFPEWANDPYFYGELVEGGPIDPNAVCFKKYRELMDLEFSDAAVSEKAQIGDQDWLICPLCIDGWECANTRDAMVKCPKCRKVMHNPRYNDRLKITI